MSGVRPEALSKTTRPLPISRAPARRFVGDVPQHDRPGSQQDLKEQGRIVVCDLSERHIRSSVHPSNLAGHSKKVRFNAPTLFAFCRGNTLGTQTFQDSKAPAYTNGKASIMACLTAQIFVRFAPRYCNDWLNKENRNTLEDVSEVEKDLLRKKLAYADETDRGEPVLCARALSLHFKARGGGEEWF